MPTNNAIDLTSQGVAYYNGTGTFSGIDGSTSGFALTSNGTGVAPSFQTINISTGFNGFLMPSSSSSPTLNDATTYYFGNKGGLGSLLGSTTVAFRYYISKSITIKNVYGILNVTGTLASAGSITVFIRVNDTTNTNITTSLAASSVSNNFNNTGLNISLSPGDFFIFGLTTPTWATNPSATFIAIGFSD